MKMQQTGKQWGSTSLKLRGAPQFWKTDHPWKYFRAETCSTPSSRIYTKFTFCKKWSKTTNSAPSSCLKKTLLYTAALSKLLVYNITMIILRAILLSKVKEIASVSKMERLFALNIFFCNWSCHPCPMSIWTGIHSVEVCYKKKPPTVCLKWILCQDHISSTNSPSKRSHTWQRWKLF